MRYSVELRKFFYSQYFFGGLRIAVGVSLPAVLFLIIFDNRELGFTIATGALGACVVDMPGPLKYKHNEMLACSVIGFFSALATGLATPNIFALWFTIVPLTFVLSLIVVYGNRWPQISFATLFMMVMTLEERFTPLQALVNASWILVGGLWYTYWATLVSRWQAHRIEQQALAESLFACATYLLARADFYDLDSDLDECYRNLVAKQITAVETQETARDIVLRNLPKLRQGKLDPSRTMMFNLFINSVDLHELFVGAHTDYPLVRNTFGGSDLMIFYRDLIRKAASDLEEIGLAVLENRRPHTRISVKAELRAIEYEIELMRKKNFPAGNAEAYAAVLTTFRRIWSATRLIDKMRRSLSERTDGQQTELKIDKTLTRFLQRRRMSPLLLFSNLNLRSPSFRHALRMTIAVAVGFWVGRLLPLTNAYWIVMTTIIILKPGYSLTKQRNAQRIIGTLIGCAASLALIYTVQEPHLLIIIMFGSMVMSYSLLLFNYGASVVFTSAYVLLMFHLLAPGNMRIIGERAIDTVVGCMIAIAASRLFPYWEYRAMGKLVGDMLATLRKYFEAASRIGRGMPAPVVPTADGAAAVPAVAVAIEAALPPLEGDYPYRLARKNVHIAFANLGQAFQRMMIEPKAHQKFVPELNDLLVQTHVLGAQITAAAPLLRHAYTQDARVDLDALERCLAAIRDNLEQAEAGSPPAADHLDAGKRVTRDLDAMVVAAEQSDAASADLTHDLKVLAHQCKQMLASSLLIRKDAGVIRLPE
ncbi:FUSC family protein [Burkholderia sp. FERM BP-3421]|uniref:FUSC family protein n=1 Tax=Burkholderia sp. FERM BP-3421 TaxID=1494466 RepID=UPI0023627A3D|nr:FUSC family membrane protein [Burkholderia sp. FERM BP-3421]WDD93570.1 FUSC family protein [Burkholderia sp. FERM BP-3421]